MERKKDKAERVRNESYADYLERRAPHYRAAGSRPDHRAIQRFVASANDLPSDEELSEKGMIRDVGSARVGKVYARQFLPAISRPEYMALRIMETLPEAELPQFLSYFSY